ncbi:hypothetical protein [Nocardia huaxiensis]|uniref:Uncharacterized protein n=1 Tax=Nocardia huaxiensis TaxID=2755382 RepID=A0A7D6V747_9NOCA|nr:hypothetical protein [Nocardia huaxiensis]QLY28051.1 hypothetical protein H0264_21880 [Nocardia huaxiensis]UFS98513.1 hypothetical protein LPY97_11715 [Nocardia huaxiensis]
MIRTPKLAAGIVAATLVLSGADIVLGAATAAADTTSCTQQQHVDHNPGFSSFWITHTYDKSIDVTTAAAGTLITYKIVVGTTSIGNPYVNSITDYPPPGFGKPVKAVVTAYHFGQGQQSAEVTPGPNNGGWSVTSTGWFVNSGNPVTAEFTYRVPDSVQNGQQIRSGGIGVGGTVGVGSDQPGMGVCFTGRGANPGEALLGSMDQGGLGSSQNQLSSTGSLTDIISGVLKNLIGS